MAIKSRMSRAQKKAEQALLVKKKPFSVYLKVNWTLYTMVLPGFLFVLVFHYFPIYGIIMAFQNFKPALGFGGSQFVGLKHFIALVKDPYFFRVFKNTLVLGLWSLIINFPAPIVFALLLNEVKHNGYKRVTQTISYMPNFLSIVIVVGMLRDLCTSTGLFNTVIVALGGKNIDFFIDAKWFRPLYVLSGTWQGIGYGSIIYLAAISGVNPELYESALIDGANRFQQAIYITFPCIAPTCVILFIFAVSGIVGNDFQKILLMYSASTYSTADVISTYTYRQGIEGTSQSYASAVGLFMSVISFILLALTNLVAKKLGDTSLW